MNYRIGWIARLSMLAMLVLYATLPSPTLRAQTSAPYVMLPIEASGYPDINAYVASRIVGSEPFKQLPAVTLEEIASGRHVPIDYPRLSIEDRGMSVMVLVDLHRRMRGIGMPGETRLQTAQRAIMLLADQIRQKAGPATQLGILGYDRDIVTILPLQPFDLPQLAHAIDPQAQDRRLFAIEDRQPNTAPNDLRDAHAKSALSLAVLTATRTLNQQTLAGRARVIVILGNTCDDLSDAQSDRKTINCDIPSAIRNQIMGDLNQDRLLSIIGVGVGSDDPKQPLVTKQNKEAGFEYTANFNQLQKFASLTPPYRFFRLFTSNAQQAATIWQDFETMISQSVAQQGRQLKISFSSSIPISNDDTSARSLEISINGKLLSGSYIAPHLTLLLNGTPVPDAGITLNPGIALLRVQGAVAGQTVSGSTIQLAIPAATPLPTSMPASTTGQPAAATDQIQTNLQIIQTILLYGIPALLVLALLYWLTHEVWGRSPGSATNAQPAAALPHEALPLPEDLDAQARLPDWRVIEGAPFVLVEINGPLPGAIFPLQDGQYRISSVKPEAANSERILYVDDPYISDGHAELLIWHDPKQKSWELHVQDLRSINKTYVNNLVLQPEIANVLEHNDLLTVGRVTFQIIRVEKLEPLIKAEPNRGLTQSLAQIVAPTQ